MLNAYLTQLRGTRSFAEHPCPAPVSYSDGAWRQFPWNCNACQALRCRVFRVQVLRQAVCLFPR